MRRMIMRDIKQMAFEHVERPQCPEDGMLMQVKSCAICATDVKIYNYGHQLIKLPRVLGHEVSGILEAVGPAAEGEFQPGQRAAVCAVINCGRCAYCLRGAPSMCEQLEAFGYHYDGGYQEYMVIPAKAIRCGGVNALADNVSFNEAAIAELLACTINGQGLSDFRMGESVLIIGSGPVGLLHAQLAHVRGASSIWMADILEEKRASAKAILGDALTGTLDNSQEEAFLASVQEATSGRGFDQVMLCCGVGAVQRISLQCVAKMGCVNFFGGLPKGKSMVELDTNQVHYKQCRIVGTHGSSALENRQALELITHGLIDVKPLVTHTIALEQLEDALQINEANAQRLKCVVQY